MFKTIYFKVFSVWLFFQKSSITDDRLGSKHASDNSRGFGNILLGLISVEYEDRSAWVLRFTLNAAFTSFPSENLYCEFWSALILENLVQICPE